MNQNQVCGLHGEGRILCLKCAGRIYGTSLEAYVRAGDLQPLWEADGRPYTNSGLMCDECLGWIYKPDVVETPWWREEPAVAENQRLLAPFASCLERLGVDVSNLREAAVAHPC